MRRSKATAYRISGVVDGGGSVEISDAGPDCRHLAFATAVFRMADDTPPVNCVGEVPFNAELWARVGPMLAAPVLLEALESALAWHQSDPWRTSEVSREAMAWEAQQQRLTAALDIARAPAPWVPRV